MTLDLLSFLTCTLGKLNVTDQTGDPKPTASKADYYGPAHVHRIVKEWKTFSYNHIMTNYGSILDTPARLYIPLSPNDPYTATIRLEQDLSEHIIKHMTETINYALDVTFQPPAYTAVKEYIRLVEGNPHISRLLLMELPHELIIDLVNQHFAGPTNINIEKSASQAHIDEAITDRILAYFSGPRPRRHIHGEMQAILTYFKVKNQNQKHMPRECRFTLLALSMKNQLSQYSISDRLYHNNRRPSPGIIGRLSNSTKLTHLRPWVILRSPQDEMTVEKAFQAFESEDKNGHSHTSAWRTLSQFLPSDIRKIPGLNQCGTWQECLNLTFVFLPAPRNRLPQGETRFHQIRMVPIGGLTLYAKLRPDFGSSVLGNPQSNRLPGDLKVSKNWRPDWPSTGTFLQHGAFWSAIAQVQCYMYQNDVRYGYVLSDAGLRCLRRVSEKKKPVHGCVEMSPVIRWDAEGSQLTVPLALWYLHMLAANDNWCKLGNRLWVNQNGNRVFRDDWQRPVDNPSYSRCDEEE